MSPAAPDASGLDAALRRLHWSALATLAACALFALLQPGGEEPSPDRTLATAGVGLAVAAILARRFATSPVMAARARFALLLVHVVCGLALGLLGAFLAANGEKRLGLGFAVGAAILCLRPPPSLMPKENAP